jgi:hypothetical protein
VRRMSISSQFQMGLPNGLFDPLGIFDKRFCDAARLALSDEAPISHALPA